VTPGSEVALTQSHFDAARLAIYDEKRNRELGECAEAVFDCVMAGTILRGQLVMYVKRLLELSRAAGFGDRKASAMEGLTKLHDWHMIWVQPWPFVERKQASAIIGFNVIFPQWVAPTRKNQVEMQQWLLSLERPPDLREAWLERFLELQISEGFAPSGGTYVRTAAISLPAGRDTRHPQELRGGLDSAHAEAGGESRPVVLPGRNLGQETIGGREQSGTKSVPDGMDVTPANAPRVAVTENVPVLLPENAVETRSGTKFVPDSATGTLFVPVSPVITVPQGSQGLVEPQRRSTDPKSTTRAREAGQTGTKSVPDPRVSRLQMLELLGEIEGLVGKADFVNAGSQSTYRKMVLTFPRAVREALDECHKLSDKAGYFKPNHLDAGRPAGTQHRICVFMKLMKRHAGINRFADVFPVPEPA
jgi:hypothetical protein